MRRIQLISISAIVLIMIFGNFIASAKSDVQKESSLKGKHILFTFGGWEGHEPRQCTMRLLPWLQSEGAIVDTSNTLDPYADEKYMEGIDLIIQTVSISKITKEQEKGLLKAVRNGAGIAGWHGGLADSYRENVEYQYMVGGQWVAHPGGIIDYEVNITDKKDPITKGITPTFKMHSEQYYMHVDPNIKVLATTTFSDKNNNWIGGCVMPVVWKKTFGKGRVFYSSLGHVATDFDGPEMFEILKRGIRWASESKYAQPEKWVSPVYPSK